MIINRQRVDRFVARKGYRRILEPDDWRRLISFVQKKDSTKLVYSYCLITQQQPPPKQVYLGSPERLLEVLHDLYIVDLTLVDDDHRKRVEEYLDRIPCPWEHQFQYEPDTDRDEVIGLRIFGFDKPASSPSGHELLTEKA